MAERDGLARIAESASWSREQRRIKQKQTAEMKVEPLSGLRAVRRADGGTAPFFESTGSACSRLSGRINRST